MASENAKIDNNEKPVAMAITDDVNQYRKMLRIDDTTKGLKVMIVGGVGAGTVTTVSVATANGFSGTVANATTTPAITIIAGAITPSSVQVSGLTASQILSTDASKNLTSLDVATYPSLTELSYVKGVTSGIQSQINGKLATGGTAAAVTGATFTTALTVNTGTVTLTGNAANNSVLTIGAGATSVSGSNTGDNATNSTYTTLATTIATANSWSAAQTFTKVVQTMTPVAAQAFDGSLGNMFTRTLANNETFTQSNFTPGQFFMIQVRQGTGTSYAVTWFGTITWITSGGTAPVQTTVSNGFTTYGFLCYASNNFYGYLVATN